ncbi:MAG: DNA/RNA non-specific endonuclease [Alistipes sp.]|nr:DNA/RNA non-specific endonuclease [Alistipes sp.]
MRLRIVDKALRGLWLLGAMWCAACSSGSEDPDVGSATVTWERATMTAEAGVARLRIADDAAPGLGWRAEITSGDWASFGNWSRYELSKEGQVGTTFASRLVDIYYLDNVGTEERTLTVRFTFEGREPVELSLRQPATGNSGSVIDPDASWAWPELPAKVEREELTYVTHFAPVYDQVQGKELTKRNFTLCFDRTKRASWWVAYPMHSAYLGNSPRPDEPWTYDPKIESSWQANLALGSYRTYGLARGHQVANADRNANRTMQLQTFYCSNSTPQNGNLNVGAWMRLEGKVRDWKCSDTLYVVTGAYWDPASKTTTTDKAGNTCPVPTHYFKVLARTRKGNVRKAGDKLGDYKADELQTIGFWVENKNVGTEADSWLTSVEEIERKTGFSFFPTLPKEAKQQKDKSLWF